MKSFKKLMTLCLLFFSLLFIFTSCGSSDESPDAAESVPQTYGLGEVWTVDGMWSFTIDSVTTTEERNEFSDKTPGQVVVVTYSYENLGYTSDMMDLYFSDSNMQIVDGNKELGYSYPGSIATYPQETPNGTRCAGAQTCIALNNPSSEITINVDTYDSNHKKQTATFVVPVS